MDSINKENKFKVGAIEHVKKGSYFHYMTKNSVAPYNLEIMALFSYMSASVPVPSFLFSFKGFYCEFPIHSL